MTASLRFGTVDTFFGLTASDLRLGRNVANHEFLKALLTHGRFDHYHFFLADLAHVEVFRQRLALLLPDPLLQKRVVATVQVALKESLQELEFTAFHQSDFTRLLPYLSSFRNRHSRTAFPITGVTHSLNTSIMPLRYLQLGLSGLQPFDAIVCTSLEGMAVVDKSFAQLASRLKASHGLELTLPVQRAHIPLGIDDARFQRHDPRESRKMLGLPADGLLLLYLGRLSARSKMDLHPLLYALAQRWKGGKLQPLKLVLAGGAEPNELAGLKQLAAQLGIADRLHFVTDFEEHLKTRLFAASDVFISLADNLQETFGLSVVEAMAAGVPPLVSDFDGYRELVRHGETGYRIPTLWAPPASPLEDLETLNPSIHPFYLAQTFVVDLDATVAALETLVGDPATRQRLSQNAIQHAQQYRWSAVVPRYEALWCRLKQEAQRSDWKPTAAPSPLAMDSFEIFQHYPTQTLHPDLRLALTELGNLCLAGAPLPVAHKDMALLLYPPFVQAVLKALHRGPQPIAALTHLGAGLELPAELVLHHLLWMTKYGLLRPEQPLQVRD